MLYTVHGTRTEIISVEVEADSESEAFELAGGKYVDVWDSDTTWHIAFKTG